MKRLLTLLIACLCFVYCGGDGPTTTTPTAPPPPPPPPPMPMIQNFSISAEDARITYSAPLTTLSASESFEVKFKPTEINEGPSRFSNTVEFWLDRGPSDDGIALGFEWNPDSEWGVFVFDDGFFNVGTFKLINVGGRFRTVTYRQRALGVASRW